MRNNQEQIRDLIEELIDLSTKDKHFTTSGVYLAYQRGILTRFIMDLVLDDFYALEFLKKRVKKLKKE